MWLFAGVCIFVGYCVGWSVCWTFFVAGRRVNGVSGCDNCTCQWCERKSR